MKILVTGGAGFIGSCLCRTLIGETAHEVLNLDKLTYAGHLSSLASISKGQRYTFLKGDICDRARIAEAFASFSPDAVLHLAAESHVDRSIAASSPFIETNILGTHVLLEAALSHYTALPAARRRKFRLLYVSTDEVYGSLGAEGAFDEKSPTDPSSPYSASKAAAGHLVHAWHRTYGLPALSVNCSNAYGPYQSPEKLTPLVIVNAVEGKPLPVYGDGKNVRDWMHVDDFVRALLLVLGKGQPGERYNVGARNELSNLEVVGRICEILDRMRPESGPHRRLMTHVADRAGHDRRYAIEPARIETELGWRPRVDYAHGLETTVRWYLDNRAWWQPLLNPGPARNAKT